MVDRTVYDVISRDSSWVRTGKVDFLKLKFVDRFNAPSSWTLTLDAVQHAKAIARLAAGNGVIIRRRDPDGSTEIVMSGPVDEDSLVENANSGTVTITGGDDTEWLWNRLIFGDPTVAADAQLAGVGDTRTGVLETVMRALVNLNAGPGALVARRIPALTLATDGLHGPTITSAAPDFAVLGDHLVALALNGPLGFRIVQVGTGLVFQVYEPADKSATVRFSFRLQNLRGYSIKATKPGATVAIVAGGETGALRFFQERTNADAATAQADWGGIRREGFVDKSDSVDPDVLDQAGDEFLAANGPQISLTFDPIDTEQTRLGREYDVGDLVTVVTRRGPVVDVVREVPVEADRDGFPMTAKPLIGSPDAEPPDRPRIYGKYRKLAAAFDLLKRRTGG